MKRRLLLSLLVLTIPFLVHTQTIRLEAVAAERSRAAKAELQTIFKNVSLFQINFKNIGITKTASQVQLEVSSFPFLQFSGSHNKTVSDDADVVLQSAAGRQKRKAPAVTHFNGITPRGKNKCHLSVGDNFILGSFEADNSVYFIEQLRNFIPGAAADQVVVYKSSDVVPQEASCGNELVQQPVSENKLNSAMPGTAALVAEPRIVDLALAVDHTSYQFHGQSIEQTTAYISSVVNLAQRLYSGSFSNDLTFKITEFVVFTSAETNPWPSTDTIGNNLSRFYYWANTGFSKPFDLAEYWFHTPKFNGGTVGLAYVPNTCNNRGNNTIREFGSTLATMQSLVAHEIGHNFNASHDAAGASYVMAPMVGGLVWSDASKQKISSWLDGPNTACMMRPGITIFSSAATAPCAGSAITFTAVVSDSSGENNLYQWKVNGVNAGSNAPRFISSSLKDGDLVSCDYTHTASGSTTIASSNNLVVSVITPVTPVIAASGALTFCKGGSVTLSASDTVALQWYKSGVALGDAARPTFTATESGLYTARTFAGGCASDFSNAITLTVNPLPATPVLSAPGNTLCPGRSIQLSSSAAVNQWFKGGIALSNTTGARYTATEGGSYTVAAVENGCVSALAPAINISVAEKPAAPVITASGATTFCAGGTVQLTASANTSVQWYKNDAPLAGATSSTLTVGEPGAYTASVSNGSCWSSPSNSVPVVVTTVPSPVITAAGNTLTATAAATYQWYLHGTAITGATSQQYKVQAAGPYTVHITQNGCSAQSAVFQFVATGIVNPAAWHNMVITFPNPITDMLYISNPAARKLNVQLIDMAGKRVYESLISTATGTLHLKPLARGMYLLLITDLKKKETISKTIVKQ